MNTYRIVSSKVDTNLTQKLKKLKPKARSRGGFTGAVLQAAFYALKEDDTYFLYTGTHYGRSVWRVTWKKSEYLNGVNNPSGRLLSVSPDMVVKEYTLKRIKKDASMWKPPKINKSLAQKVNKKVKKYFVINLLNDYLTKNKDWREGLKKALSKAVAPTQMSDLINAQGPIKKWLGSISNMDLVKIRDWVEEIQNKGKSEQRRIKPEAWKKKGKIMDLHSKIAKLANDNPELRKHLVPLLK